jgi:glycosyltransferase involved in cell wall biosynthesis
MNLISVITPAYNPVPDQLAEAYNSLRSQELPDGWAWEWVLQEDGATGVLQTLLPQDPQIKFGTGRHGGVALTRNMALARSGGELVKNLDQDDVLTPGVLARDIEVMTANPEVGWTTSRVLDLLPDGSTVGFPNDPEHGQLEPGFVVDHWRTHNYRLPVHPTTVCIRRSLAIALGGWMAVPGSDDTGLLVAASVISPGYFREEVGLFYRKWPGQESAQPGHRAETEWNTRMNLISERADALAALWQARITAD